MRAGGFPGSAAGPKNVASHADVRAGPVVSVALVRSNLRARVVVIGSEFVDRAGLALFDADHARSEDSQIIAANLASTPQRHGLSTSDAGEVSDPLVRPVDWDDFTTMQ